MYGQKNGVINFNDKPYKRKYFPLTQNQLLIYINGIVIKLLMVF